MDILLIVLQNVIWLLLLVLWYYIGKQTAYNEMLEELRKTDGERK